MTVLDLMPTLSAFQRAVASVDTARALEVVDEALVGGADPIALLTEVVGAAQRVVGERWQRGEWSVAQEHAATAVATAATEAIARQVRQQPPRRGRVIVACAEREWHVLPAMMIECALRSAGWDTTLLGASTPALRLNQYLQDVGPDALAVSCSMLGSLPTTRRFIEASTAAGIPILVGGPAFGSDDVRAKSLGATAWAADAVGAIEAIEGLPAVVPAADPLPEEAVVEQAALELGHSELLARITASWPTDGLEADLVKDSVEQLLHSVWAALLTGDPHPIPQTVWWLSGLLESRRVPSTSLNALRAELTRALRDYPLASSLLSTSWP